VRLTNPSRVLGSILLLSAAVTWAGEPAAMRDEVAAASPQSPSLPAVDPALSTSSAGLAEEPAPGGGVMVDLRGRFRSEVGSTVDADGGVRTECRTLGHTIGR
jgi:hypothetical protein